MESQAPATQNTEAEQRRNAVEVGSYTKKLVDAYRLLEPNHPTFREIEENLWNKVASYLERFGDIALEISPTSVAIEDRIIIEANRKQDSVSFPLFAEGIHEVVFGRDISREEVIGFIRMWADACIRMNSEQQNFDEAISIKTQVWEADYASVELIGMTSVHEGQGEDGEEDSEYLTEVREAVRAISGGEGSDDGDFGLGQAGHLLNGTGANANFWSKAAETDGLLFKDLLAADDTFALQLLSAELGLQVQPASLKKLKVKGTVNQLTQERCDKIIEELSAPVDDNWPKAYIRSTFILAIDANSDELAAIVQPLERLFVSLAEEGRFEFLTTSLNLARQDLLNISTNANQAAQVLSALHASLISQPVLDAAFRALEHPTTRDNAKSLLELIPPGQAKKLLDRMDELSTPLGIDAMVEILSKKSLQTEDIAYVARNSKPEVAKGIIRLTAMIRPEDVNFIRKQVLQHPNPAFRRGILASISMEEVPANLQEIRPLLLDEDAAIRATAALMVAQVKDQQSLGSLAEIINGDFSEDEQKRAVVAISKIGGTAAGLALRKIFMQQKNLDLRCVAALGLGDIGDQAAQPLLEKEAKKILSRGRLKASCLEALRRLEVNKQQARSKARGQ
ncbi:MAG: HEAT repeat domain-containing protein [Myxococcota bacterium]|nr:HEAT repeat domain-containing protein [Myxococcota bacterium]